MRTLLLEAPHFVQFHFVECGAAELARACCSAEGHRFYISYQAEVLKNFHDPVLDRVSTILMACEHNRSSVRN